jgi:1-acyl-sn-glycerol-3-phosphate acyltransferase
MLYQIVKIIARAAIKLYCRSLQINKPELLKYNGPLLMASNHPNSFLDAIILCTIFERPVYSLARGDAFKGKLISKILTAFKMLPVYRISEGVENLEGNYKTFDQCKEIFKQNGIVLIFSEGKCINEWHLRPLKKGTARLAISSWEDGIPLKVLPVGINYSSFKTFGKNVRMFFGEFITMQDVDFKDAPGKSILAFNTNLQQQLSSFVFEIPETDKVAMRETFYIHQSLLKKTLLFLPAAIGWLLNAPLYFPVKNFVINKTTDTDHFDSVVVGILLVVYPLYVSFITLIVLLFSSNWYALVLYIIFPFTAWSYLQLKKQIA